MAKARRKRFLQRFVLLLACVLAIAASCTVINTLCGFDQDQKVIVDNLKGLVQKSIIDENYSENYGNTGYEIVSKYLVGVDLTNQKETQYRITAVYRENGNEIHVIANYSVRIDGNGVITFISDIPQSISVNVTIGIVYKFFTILIVVFLFALYANKLNNKHS